MPDLFSPYTLKGVTLRNRIAMSPMTMYRSIDGRMSDYHVMLLGARAAGGFGLVFTEQMAVTPDGAHQQVGIPVGVSWNLGDPLVADGVIREHLLDLVLLGRPALANPHWPLWAARELGHTDPFSLVPEDWAWWLRNLRGHETSIGWPPPAPDSAEVTPLPRRASGT